MLMFYWRLYINAYILMLIFNGYWLYVNAYVLIFYRIILSYFRGNVNISSWLFAINTKSIWFIRIGFEREGLFFCLFFIFFIRTDICVQQSEFYNQDFHLKVWQVIFIHAKKCEKPTKNISFCLIWSK